MNQLSNYDDLILEKPFRILLKNKDATVFMKDEHTVRIYFHNLKQWVNPPTNNMLSRIVRNINKVGVEYLKDGEQL